MREPAAITGMGMICAAGASVDQTWDAISAERSGLGALTLFRSPRCGHIPVGQVRVDVAARSGLASGSRTDHLAACASRQAFADAGLEALPAARREAVGLVLGTCTGGMIDGEEFMSTVIRETRVDLSLLRHHMCSCPADAVAGALGLAGPRVTISDACASGADAIETALDILDSGEAEIVLAGGADSLTRLTLNGFASLLNVSPGGCRPFDAGRDGMSLGEGAGVIVMERPEHARMRGARVRAYVAGAASTCDAFHSTAPRPGGAGAQAAMQKALASAGLSPGDVGYINAHGTGTLDNDAAEGAAIGRVFDGAMPLVSSTKGFFGHTLAAAGAIEAIVCVLALAHQCAPANLGLARPDSALGFSPVMHHAPANFKAALSNSLGFGGVNSSLVILGAQS